MRHLLLMVATGCAGGGNSQLPDSSTRVDAAPVRDAQATQDSDLRDGPVACEQGQHPCPAGCTDDQPDEPIAGCRLGCGRPCDVPENGESFCDTGGRCAVRCRPPYALVEDRCECTPKDCMAEGAECGAVSDGCGGVLACGECADGMTCSANLCGCAGDAAEPNDALTTAKRLGRFGYGTSQTFSSYGLAQESDVDWFEAEIADDSTLPGFAPTIRVALSGAPLGSDHALAVYFRCGAGGTPTLTCLGGSDTTDDAGRGCLAAGSGAAMIQIDGLDCPTTDESGTLAIRVSATRWGGRCGAYTLQVSVPDV
jgi:hypothetical protein